MLLDYSRGAELSLITYFWKLYFYKNFINQSIFSKNK